MTEFENKLLEVLNMIHKEMVISNCDVHHKVKQRQVFANLASIDTYIMLRNIAEEKNDDDMAKRYQSSIDDYIAENEKLTNSPQVVDPGSYNEGP